MKPFSARPSSIPRIASSSRGVLTCWSTATAGIDRHAEAWSVRSSSAEAPPSRTVIGSQRRMKAGMVIGASPRGQK
jgi:hypothetical protein